MAAKLARAQLGRDPAFRRLTIEAALNLRLGQNPANRAPAGEDQSRAPADADQYAASASRPVRKPGKRWRA